MQVFGLSGHISRNGRGRSRLLAAKPSTKHSGEKTGRRGALAAGDGSRVLRRTGGRGRRGPALDPLSLAQQAEPRSKRPRRAQAKTSTPALVEAVEGLRLDHPMWGRAKLGPLLRRQGSPSRMPRVCSALVKRRHA
jgi:putative transposase